MALAEGERVVVRDLEVEAALAGSDDLREYRRSGLRAVQSTPLVAADGGVVGMMSTHWRTPCELSAPALRRIDSLASRCAWTVALERPPRAPAAGLLHDVNRNIRKLTSGFDSLATDDPPQKYICECGCGQWFPLTGDDFDARLAAAESITIHGHLVARAQAAREQSRILQHEADALRQARVLRDAAAALRSEARQIRQGKTDRGKPRPTPPSG